MVQRVALLPYNLIISSVYCLVYFLSLTLHCHNFALKNNTDEQIAPGEKKRADARQWMKMCISALYLEFME